MSSKPVKPDLLGALAPRGSASESYASIDGAIGAVAFMAIASLLAKGVRAGAGFMQSDKGRKLLGKLQESEKQAKERYKLYRARYERASNEGSKKRWKRRMDRAKERWDTMRVQNKLAQQGITGEGPVLEFRRNLLAQEWDDAGDDRKKEIEAEIATMDKRLHKLKREADLMQSYKGSAALASTMGRELSLPPRWRKQRDLRGLISGHGGIDFHVQSPPGPAREVRIPFYPENDNQEYNNPAALGAGIDQAGDNPIVNLQIAGGVINSGFIPMVTRPLEYGTYRIIGIQTNMGLDSYVDENVTLFGVGVTIRNLRLYNGQKLLLTAEDGELDAMTFSILPNMPGENLAIGPFGTGYPAEVPTSYARRKSRQFSGLRDYPIVSDNAVVRLDAAAFTTPAWIGVAGNNLNVPFTCNLVAEIVEDRVYGNIVNPSPAARAGAVVKVGARELGRDSEGRDRLQVVSAYRRS